jgi:molybdate transport system permease protein
VTPEIKTPLTPRSRSASGIAVGALSFPLLVFLALPLAALFYRASFANVVGTLQQESAWQAIHLSITTTLTTTFIVVLSGTPVAYLLARRTFRFKRLLDTLIDLPSVMPPSVAGVALLMAFGRQGVIGPLLDLFGISIAFTSVAVVIAQTFIAVPFYIRAATLGFAAIDREIEQSAMLDGATNLQVFRHITVPLSWAALVSGAVTAWARALGEFGATILFAGNFPGRTQTMPLAIYIGFEIDLDIALTLSVILITLAAASLFTVRILLQRFQAQIE